MKTNINIAEILKDMPKGTKLYSTAFGEVTYDAITYGGQKIWVLTKDKNYKIYLSDGRYRSGGEVTLYPSKEMRDWRKFSWKKGDVLVSNDNDSHIIFKGFSKGDYTTFEGKYWISVSKKRHISCLNAQNVQDYHIEDDKDAVQTYINTIEERLGGKLNRESLEAEKTQPEFKDWDFITIKLHRGRSLICVFKAENDENYYLHASLDSRGMITINEDSYCSKSGCIVRLSTEEEKTVFFDALAKKGKTWDAVKKQILDLKPKIELKPFDKVLVRDGKNEIWEPAFFFRNLSHLNVYNYQTVGGESRVYCIPFNEETAKLIGTTDDWKG